MLKGFHINTHIRDMCVHHQTGNLFFVQIEKDMSAYVIPMDDNLIPMDEIWCIYVLSYQTGKICRILASKSRLHMTISPGGTMVIVNGTTLSYLLLPPLGITTLPLLLIPYVSGMGLISVMVSVAISRFMCVCYS